MNEIKNVNENNKSLKIKKSKNIKNRAHHEPSQTWTHDQQAKLNLARLLYELGRAELELGSARLIIQP